MKYIAHRGIHEQYPENSKEAIQEAIKSIYYDGFECDIQISQDGVFFVFHDETLMRLCGKDERLDNLQSKVIMNMPYLSYPSSTIASLDDILKLVQDTKKTILIEIKPILNNNQKNHLEELLKQYTHLDIHIISFHASNFLKTYPFHYIVSRLSLKELWKLKKLHIHSLNLNYRHHRPMTIKCLKKIGFSVSIWTLDVYMKTYLDLPLTFLTTNVLKKHL